MAGGICTLRRHWAWPLLLIRAAIGSDVHYKPNLTRQANVRDLTKSSSTCPIFCKPTTPVKEGESPSLFCIAKTELEVETWLTQEHGMDWRAKLPKSTEKDFLFFEAATGVRHRNEWCLAAGCVMFAGECAGQTTMMDLRLAYGDTIPLTSEAGQQYLAELESLGLLTGFLRMSQYYRGQPRPSYCAITTLTIMLNYLLLRPPQMLEFYSFWDEDKLMSIYSADVNKKMGSPPVAAPFERVLTLIADIRQKTKLNEVPSFMFSECLPSSQPCTAQQLATDLHAAAVDPTNKIVIANFHRRRLAQVGGGHWSPLIGTNCDGQEVPGDGCKTIIFDVARYNFEPQIVGLNDFHMAMAEKDPDSILESRGWILITRLPVPE